MQNKVKISQKDFNDLYEIDEGITEETQASPKEISAQSEIPTEDTTPEFLTEEEQEQDNYLHDNLNTNEEQT